jgi:hypothetical protein
MYFSVVNFCIFVIISITKVTEANDYDDDDDNNNNIIFQLIDPKCSTDVCK